MVTSGGGAREPRIGHQALIDTSDSDAISDDHSIPSDEDKAGHRAVRSLVFLACASLVVICFGMSFTGTRDSGFTIKMVRIPRLRTQRLDLGGNLPLGGDFRRSGEYSMVIWLGNAGEELPFTVQVDTGSAILGLPSVGCKGCRHNVHPWYAHKGATPVPCENDLNVNCSHCVQQMHCGYNLSYYDGAGFEGMVYQDRMSFGVGDGYSGLSTTVFVSAIYKMTDNFQPHNIDGIIGFADDGDSIDGSRPPPFEGLIAAGKLENIFAMCMHDTGGRMYFGSDARAAAQRIASATSELVQWVKLTSDNFYPIEMLDMKVNGASIGVHHSHYNEGLAIIDSGCTDIQLVAPAFNALRDTFFEICRTGVVLKGVCDPMHDGPANITLFDSGLPCFSMTTADLNAFPTLQFQFSNGVELELEPLHYLRNGSAFCDDGQYGLAFQSDGPVGSGTLLGDTFMQPFLTIFDRENKRVGFIKTPEPLCG